MKWLEIVAQIEEQLTKPLPGASAHEPLRATPTGLVKPKFEHKLPPKLGSVMILLFPDGGQLKFPLTKRPEYLGAHGGQVSLPGGKAEAGESEIETALRETEEEIGVNRNAVRVLGKLSNFFVIPSNFMVTPIVGFINERPTFKAQETEVVRIIEGSIVDLIKLDAIRSKEIIAAKVYPMFAPHFEIEGEIVWGATAMMLNEFRTVVTSIVS
jgi:8-oxo-dGTP pyrophosphatase MutT (NUDIX family)